MLAIAVVLLLGAAGVLGFPYFDARARGGSLAAEVVGSGWRQLDVAKEVLDGNGLLEKVMTAQNAAEFAQRRVESTSRKVVDCQKAASAMREAVLVGTDHEAARKVAKSCFDGDAASYQDALTAPYVNC